MKIRDRMLVILLISTIALLTVGNATYGRFFHSHLLADEEAQLTAGMNGIAQHIRERQRRYEGSVQDWAYWDETYSFLNGEDPRYPERNLAAATFGSLDLSLFVLTNLQHQPVTELQFDPETGEFIPFTSALQQALPQAIPWQDQASSSSLLVCSGDLYLLAVSPVRDSLLQQPANGFLVFGRKLDAAMIAELEQLCQGRISLSTWGALDKAVVEGLGAAGNRDYASYSQIAGEKRDQKVGYLLLDTAPSAEDTPMIVLTRTREAYYQGVASLRWMLTLYSALTIMVVLSLLYVMRRSVYRPLAKMEEQLRRFDVQADQLQPISTDGVAELIAFADTINSLIDRLDHGRRTLQESERSKALLLANLPGMAYRCLVDRNYTMQFVSEGCLDLTGYRPEQLVNNRDLAYNDIICSEYREEIWQRWAQAIADHVPLGLEYPITTATGRIRWVFEQGQGVYDQAGHPVAIEGLIIDVTAQKEREAEVRYISEHDYLTGLHNRTRFEQAMLELDSPENLPLSVVMGDINGLKLINDAFGHAEGDKLLVAAAELLRQSQPRNSFLARVGGDEFALLLPNTSRVAMQALIQQVQLACDRYNLGAADRLYYVSISLGGSTKLEPKQSLGQVNKQAEDAMYKRKLLESRSLHSALTSSIQAALFARSQETGEHAARLVALSQATAARLGLSDDQKTTLELFAVLHDIGKIGIENKILNKPGPLTEEEWVEMKKHSEIGYRIAMSSQELMPIAQYVRSHHERWDGQGYPDGLSQEGIPLLARILSVADAYDAMTSDRPYRRAMPRAEALAEISRGAGTQFDPQVVEAFLQVVAEEEDR